ncbi:MAG: hypothetical protein M1834_006278 [Cirrosporium novae-zelandiae]|nr:MAG: hypothetical protein M1834_006278 [Cirrosporium novae-zelandiae]
MLQPLPLVLALLQLLITFGAAYPASGAQVILQDGNGADETKLGAVASENAICSQIGIDILKQGGNSADALIGTTICVGVIGMYHSGIGGGGFMLVRSPNGTYEAIDFRETAPAAAFEDMYKSNVEGSVTGGLASGVPGELRGLEYLHSHYGLLPWRTVFQPAIKVARDGFPVNADLVRIMHDTIKLGGHNFLTLDPSWAMDFAPNGTLLGLGDIMTRKRFAQTLETIAEWGADAFYAGPIAKTMIAALEASNGTMTMEDLANYSVVLREPVSIDYRGHRVTSMGSPSSGTTLLSALKIVEGFQGFEEPDMLNLSTHRLVEATRFAYGKRSELGDPSFLDEYIDQYERNMTSGKETVRMRGMISDFSTLNVSAYNPSGFENRETHGTSHIVTADASGLAITMTTTINGWFGSQVMVPETGIIMNNEMNDFSIPNTTNIFGYVPSPSNYIRPGKRPLSSITPIIATHSLSSPLPYLIIGAAGGSRIITSTLQCVWHVLDHHMNVPAALEMPRFHDQLMPNLMFHESAYDTSTISFLKNLNHNATEMPSYLSAVQGIRWLPNGTFEAAGEPRQMESAGLAV